MSVAEKLTAIADKIRYYSPDPLGALTLDDMAKRIPMVYNTGVLDGEVKGMWDGIEQGKKDAYNEFWDDFQQNGDRTNYDYAFTGSQAWSDVTFKPKYRIAPTSAEYMFLRAQRITDLKKLLDDMNVTLDFSNCTNVNQIFNSANTITHLPKLDFSKATVYSNLFGWCSALQTIDELVFNPNVTASSNMFASCGALKNLKVSGTIAVSVSFLNSPLTKESIISVIEALSTTSGGTLTLRKATVNAIDWTSTMVDGILCNSWTDVINTRSNWTIAL